MALNRMGLLWNPFSGQAIWKYDQAGWFCLQRRV